MVVTLDMGLEGELNSITDLSSHTHIHSQGHSESQPIFENWYVLLFKTSMYHTTFSEKLVLYTVCTYVVCTTTKLQN